MQATRDFDPLQVRPVEREDILSMFSAVSSQHSGVDICINNAGLAGLTPCSQGQHQRLEGNVQCGAWGWGLWVGRRVQQLGGTKKETIDIYSQEESRKVDIYGQEESRKIDIWRGGFRFLPGAL